MLGGFRPMGSGLPRSYGKNHGNNDDSTLGSRRAELTGSRAVDQRICPTCSCQDVEEVDGQQICLSCGTLVSETDIVAEVMFGETDKGAAVVQGGFVGEDQRYARSMGKAFRKVAGGSESREQSLKNGRAAITALATSLHIMHSVDPAIGLYTLAHANGFIQGRPTQQVAATCLYVACRRNRDNTVLLIDFAEKLQINVYILGNVYKALVEALYLNFHDAGLTPLVEIEPLLLKYAQRLEFGEQTSRVAADAAKILARMDRDWMVTGRTPNGLCGACLILAARMNNFRRSIREVVYVVKTSDATILQRLAEFKQTTAGQLTVEEFRKYAKRLKKQHDPPALYLAEKKARRLDNQRLKRRMEARQRVVIPPSTNCSYDSTSMTAPSLTFSQQTVQTSTQASSSAVNEVDEGSECICGSGCNGICVAPPANLSHTLSAQLGFDINNFAESGETSQIIPTQMVQCLVNDETARDDVMADMTATEPGETVSSLSKLTLRKRNSHHKRPRLVITNEDLLAEEELEDEIETILDYEISENVYMITETHAREYANRVRSVGQWVSDSVEIRPDEFDDDPEIANCLLTEPEIRVKEKIWVTLNADWLRAQQMKQILREKAELLNGGIRAPRKKRRSGRMGDGTLLRESEPVSSAAEATARMLEKRLGPNASRKVNYDLLRQAYGGTVEDMNRSLQRTELARTEKRRAEAEKRKLKKTMTAMSSHDKDGGIPLG